MPEPLNIFVSYSRRDKKWLEVLRIHLTPLVRDEHVDVWDDTRIKAGVRWKDQIEQALGAAHVAILLVSKNFLASDFIHKEELQPLLKAAEEKGLVILPLIVGFSLFEKTPILSMFQAVNDPRRPLASLRKPQRDEAFVHLAKRILEVYKDRQAGPAETPPPVELPPAALPAMWQNSLGMTFVRIPAGAFEMGSNEHDREKPVHRVTISRSFYLGVHPVTQGQWKAVMKTEPWKGKANVQEGGDYPAVYVSWEDVRAFVNRLKKQEGERRYRLPTEAEWEYACRAGSTTAYSFGDDAGRLGEYAWYKANAWDVGERYAHRVGQKRPNAWGLYDMHGNVWEWVSDWYGAYAPEAVTDPQGPSTGSYRVIRGGSSYGAARSARSANRYNTGQPLRHLRFSSSEGGVVRGPYPLRSYPWFLVVLKVIKKR